MPLSYEDGVLSFSCSSKYKVGKSAKVKLTLVFREQLFTPTVSMTVQSFEPAADGTFVCSGAVDMSRSKQAELENLMMHAGVKGADRRASRRMPYTIRILSKELSSFRAVTTNINLNGVELNCDNPVATGHLLNLQLDLESAGVRELKLPARCLWSQEEVDESRRSRYRVGVGFGNGEPSAMASWAKFYRGILANDGQSVMQRTMDGDSVPDKGKELVDAADAATAAQAPPAPPPPSLPTSPASPAGNWTSPPTGNPFASQPMPAVPSSPDGGFTFPSTPQTSPGLNFSAPQGAVPSPNQMGGGFNTQAAPPPPLMPNKLSLPPAGQPQPPKQQGGGLSLPEAPGSGSGGYSFPSTPSAPSFPSAGSSGGFSVGPSSGFSTPGSPSMGGFQLPSQPTHPAVGSGFSPPSSAPGFQLPQPPASPPGFQFPPQQPAGGGFSFPPSNPSSSGGFPTPSQQPPSFAPPAFGAPAQPGGGGFQLPPPPPPPGGSFNFPPPQPAAGFASPAQPPQQGFSFPQPQSHGPEPVAPLGIQGANLAFRSRYDASFQVGMRKQVQLTLNVGGQSTPVPVNVTLARVEPAPDGTCVCWCNVLEDEQKIAILNQILGAP